MCFYSKSILIIKSCNIRETVICGRKAAVIEKKKKNIDCRQKHEQQLALK